MISIIKDYGIDDIINYLNGEIKHVRIKDNSNPSNTIVDINVSSSPLIVSINKQLATNKLVVTVNIKGSDLSSQLNASQGGLRIKSVEMYDNLSNPPMFEVSYINPLEINTTQDEITINVDLETTTSTLQGIPGTISSSNLTSSSVTISWNEPVDKNDLNISTYAVYMNGDLKTQVPSTTNEATIAGLNPNTTYVFMVQSIFPSGYSDFSESYTVLTPSV